MIYTTGTVSTVSGSAIVSGTGTKWTVNNPAIRAGTLILIKNGNMNYPYMVDRVNSDTELVISQPATFTVKNTSYSINLTEPNSYSDANNRMTAIASDTTYFLRAMDQWMMNNGVVTIELSNGQKVTLDSIKKMREDIANKADLVSAESQFFNGQVISFQGLYNFDKSNPLNYFGLKRAQKNDLYGFYLSYENSSGKSAGYSINFPKKTSGTILLQSGNQATIKATNNYAGLTLTRSNGFYSLLETNPSDEEGSRGVFCNLVSRSPSGSNRGVISFSETVSGTVLVDKTPNTVKKQSINRNGFYQCQDIGPYDLMFMGIACTHVSNEQYVFSLWGRRNRFLFSTKDAGEWLGTWEVWTTANARPDTNGFIKKASPIIDINPDGTFTTNDESEGATVTRIAQGAYLIKGVLGFNADASWGGVDGGIEIPLDVNKQPLIWVNSKVNKDGSILVKTYHRTHPNAPEFANNKIDGFNDGDPIDIPNGRFISVRVQMPEQSIYNVRMREMEEAQKVEEERRQKEEEMKEQYGLGENDALL
ncbi:hypothetical protein [Proteus mirabilis]|uniref:phage tail fiber protein n=2 Tax=Proteus mirabilis TaxID=584 RepID=UPI003316317B